MIQFLRLLRCRIKAWSWSVRGGSVGRKVSVGTGCRVDYPRGVQLEERVTLEPNVWLKLVGPDAKLSFGQRTFVGSGSEFDVSCSVRVGANTLIAPRVFVTDHTHGIEPGELISEQGCDSRPVTIGNGVWIGTSVTILCGVTIGDGAVIGAGSVVRQDIPANEIWAGVPARFVRGR